MTLSIKPEARLEHLSPAVLSFAYAMQEKLDSKMEEREDSYKRCSWDEIKSLMRLEILELQKEFREATEGDSRKVTLEAADIANFALFAALIRGRLEPM